MNAFSNCAAEGRAALIPFLAACDPGPDAFVDIALAAEAAGADLIEVGLPYPDSLADGPVIQAAYARAIGAGADTRRAFDAIARLGARARAPIVLMSAYNPIRARGLDRFVAEAADAGIAALLVPDLPLEHGAELRDHARRAGLDVPMLVAPDTPEERAADIVTAASGFVYLVRRRGVTGAAEDSIDTGDRVRRLRATSGLPIAVGFGISSPARAAAEAVHADGVIVGSALVARIGASPAAPSGSLASSVGADVQSFAHAVRGARIPAEERASA